MTARERILTIRLMEKLQKQPVYANAPGIEVVCAVGDPNKESDLKNTTNV